METKIPVEKRLMSLSDKKDKEHFGVKVYHTNLRRVHPFVVTRTTASFMYDIRGIKYKRTYIYGTLAEAEMKQFKMTKNFLSNNGLSMAEYHKTLENLMRYTEDDNS